LEQSVEFGDTESLCARFPEAAAEIRAMAR